jgi:hypothetical protein
MHGYHRLAVQLPLALLSPLTTEKNKLNQTKQNRKRWSKNAVANRKSLSPSQAPFGSGTKRKIELEGDIENGDLMQIPRQASKAMKTSK